MGNGSKDYLSNSDNRNFFISNTKRLLSKYEYEHIRYCLNQNGLMNMLEPSLLNIDDPMAISQKTLKAACDFYKADWAGIVIVDFNLNIWRPYWWYNPSDDDLTMHRILDCESSEYLERWGIAMKENKTIFIPDTSLIQIESPMEFELYNRLNAKSLLAVPFKPRPVGFMVLRNPQRYVDQSNALRFLTYVELFAVKEHMFYESKKYIFKPEDIKSDKEIIINVFGGLEIYSSKGILHEDDIKSPRMCRLLIYLLINKRASYSPRKIAEDIWSEYDMDIEMISKNIRGLIYRFRQVFSLISNYQLIESTANGYRLNPALRITTDMENFDIERNNAQAATWTIKKIDHVKKALSIYKGEIYPAASGEHWLAPTSHRYSFKYIGLAHELLVKLADAEEWDSVYHYAAQAVSVLPGNVKAYFWLIVGMYKSGAVELAVNEVAHAKSVLTVEEFSELQALLNDASNNSKLHINLFQRTL